MTRNSSTPPRNAKHVFRWNDLPHGSTPTTYEIVSPDGRKRTITVKGGNRRVLEGLMHSPLYCASPVRISDRVLTLKRDYGLNIRTERYCSGKAATSERFGVYFLDDAVQMVRRGEDAA